MEQFIGEKLEDVVSLLEQSKEKYVVENNNHNVCGDTILVTNVQKRNGVIVLTTGEFIFDVKGNFDAKKIR
ncbi:MAG: hypothetical protein IJA69_05450 [Clostridia bacterium]|nr:hypothetical protein [Clostridia bacterium]